MCTRLFDLFLKLKREFGDPPFEINHPKFWQMLYGVDLSDDEDDDDPSTSQQQQGGFLLRSGRCSSPPRKRVALSPTEEQGSGEDANASPTRVEEEGFAGQDANASPNRSPSPPPAIVIDDIDDEAAAGDDAAEEVASTSFRPEDYFNIRVVRRPSTPKFHLERLGVYVSFKDGIPSGQRALESCFEAVLQRIRAEVSAHDQDRVGLVIDHPSLDRPICFPMSNFHQLTAAAILTRISQVQLSKKVLRIDSEMTAEVVFRKRERGSGNPVPRYPFGRFLKAGKGHCFVQIENEDHLCFARAVAIAIDYEHKDDGEEGKRNYKTCALGGQGRNNRQFRRAFDLMEVAGLRAHIGACGVDEWKAMQKVLLPKYLLKIVSKACMDTIVFPRLEDQEAILQQLKREGRAEPIPLYLYLHDGHFSVITTMPGFVRRSYWCDRCNRGRNSTTHQCLADYCTHCKQNTGCKQTGPLIRCNDCDRDFLSEECYENHRRKSPLRTGKARKARGKQEEDSARSVCELVRFCTVCRALINGLDQDQLRFGHRCGKRWCRNCREFINANQEHLCYIAPLPPLATSSESAAQQPDSSHDDDDDDDDSDDDSDDVQVEEGRQPAPSNSTLIVYDFETYQDWEVSPGVFEHVVNSVTAHKICLQCEDGWSLDTKCSSCKQAWVEFDREPGTALADFVNWLYQPENKGATVVAHNAGKFDSHFILRQLVKDGVTPKPIIARGTQLLLVKLQKQFQLKDSLQFMPMSLAKVAAAFKIPQEKGYFPYLFDTPQNATYVGEWPPVEMYNPERMYPEDRQRFLEWHAEQQGKQFDMYREKQRYRRNDVDILRQAVCTFDKLFRELGVAPFTEATTIASTCSILFRRKYLKPKTIGLIPKDGYRGQKKFSAIALRWISYEEEVRGIEIQSAAYGGEKKVWDIFLHKTYHLDGYYRDPTTGEETAFEFMGCAWHGCPRCYRINRDTLMIPGHNPQQLTLEAAYQRTLERLEFLREHRGMRVVVMWECELEELKKTNQRLREHIDDVRVTGIPTPLGPREAFYGGRTFTSKLYHAVSGQERILHYDVCSEYPYVCKYGRYPLGHPEIITSGFPRRLDPRQPFPYFGVFKGTVLPPQDLLHPVLPAHYKISGAQKLLFPLCDACARLQLAECPDHSDQERAIHGAWITPELERALQRGYRIVAWDEVHHYPRSTQFQPENPEGESNAGLFAEYINEQLKIKLEASGWPDGVESEEEKLAYIEEIYQKEGVRLDKDRIEFNAGLRLIGKLDLNTLWGKFGQRPDLMQTVLISDPEEYFRLDEDPTVEMGTPIVLSDDVICVNYKRMDDWVPQLLNTNPVIASFVAGYGRLHLLGFMDKLGSHLFYGDTDSVIFCWDFAKGEPPLQLGRFLGDLTSEMRPQHYAREFVSTGPKSYAYKVYDLESGAHVGTPLKMKGIALKSKVQELINFASMKQQVDLFINGERGDVEVDDVQIRRAGLGRIQTVYGRKHFKAVLNKRVVLKDYFMVPFGYRGPAPE